MTQTTLVWIFEKITCFEESVLRKLLPYFSVRVFETFDALPELLSAARPASVLVHLDSLGLSLAACEEQLRLLPAKKLALSQAFGCGVHSSQAGFSCGSTQLSETVLCGFLQEALQEGAALQGAQQEYLIYKDLRLNLESLELRFLASERVEHLPLKEARLLKFFMQHPLACWSRQALQHKVWDKRKISARTIDSHVSRLRSKLRDSQVELTNKYGEGYFFS